jgi:hypothetical protein
MSLRWSVGASVLTIAALAGVPANSQSPAPPCPAGVQIAPNRLEFSPADGTGQATQSLTATHPAQLQIYLPTDSILALTDPAIHITGPPGLTVNVPNNVNDPTSLSATFVPTAPGTLTFNATWMQLAQEGGSNCTASASPSVSVTAPTRVRALKTVGYSIGHRAKKPGTTNEFTILALVQGDPATGDESPIRMAVRAVTAMRRPSARSPVTSVTLDPANIPAHGVRASTSLVRLTAGQHADDWGVYEFKLGVFVHSHGRRPARRGIQMTLTQGSRTLATYNYVTSCSSGGHGLLECIPLPKGVRP